VPSIAVTIAVTPTIALNPTSAAQATAPTAAATAAPLQLVQNALQAQGQAKSFRVSTTVVAGGFTATSTSQVVPPNRLDIVSNFQNTLSESILIDSTMYLRLGSGPWRKMAGNPSAFKLPFRFLDPQQVAQFASRAGGVKFLGQQTLNGTPTSVYQYNSVIPEMSLSGTTKLWVATADNLPRRMDLDTTEGIGGFAISIHTTSIFSNYNDPSIAINPPIP
jgi:hypothetical protein